MAQLSEAVQITNQAQAFRRGQDAERARILALINAAIVAAWSDDQIGTAYDLKALGDLIHKESE